MPIRVDGIGSSEAGIRLSPASGFNSPGVMLFIQTNGVITTVRILVVDLAFVAFAGALVPVTPFNTSHDYKLCWNAATQTATLELDGVAQPAATLVAAGANLADPNFSESFLVASQSGFSSTLEAGPYCIRKATGSAPPPVLLGSGGVPVSTLLKDLMIS
jgi:hypothetical protein